MLPGGFLVLPVTIKHASRTTHHPLYFKQHHAPRDNIHDDDASSTSGDEPDALPPSRTLFFINAPSFLTYDHFHTILSPAGLVQRVQQHPSTPHAFHVVMATNGALQKALALPDKLIKHLHKRPSLSISSSTDVIDQWRHSFHQQRPQRHTYRDKINTFMAEYDDRVEQERRAMLSKTNQVDEDGWVTVTRASRRHTDGKVSVDVAHAGFKHKEVKKKPVLVDFYRFQQRESKRKHLDELRKKFEADKARMARLKEQRKFRPF